MKTKEERNNEASQLESILYNLITKWDLEGSFLNTEHDEAYDRIVGQTLKKCASELRSIINA